MIADDFGIGLALDELQVNNAGGRAAGRESTERISLLQRLAPALRRAEAVPDPDRSSSGSIF